MNQERHPVSQSEWAPTQFNSFRRTAIFANGRRLKEEKYPRKGINRVTEVYPQGEVRSYLIPSESMDSIGEGLQRLSIASTPLQISLPNEQQRSRTEIFAPKDQRLYVAVSTNIETGSWGDFRDNIATITYNSDGTLNDIKVKLEKGRTEGHERTEGIGTALPLLVNYLKTASPDSEVFDPHLDYYYDQVSDLNDKDQVALIHNQVRTALDNRIERLFSPADQLDVKALIHKTALEKDIVGFIISCMNISGDSFLETSRKYPMPRIIQSSINNQILEIKMADEVKHYREIELTEISADSFTFEEIEVAERESRPEKTSVQTGEIEFGIEIFSQDTKIKVDKVDGTIVIRWIKGGVVTNVLTCPKMIDAKGIRSLAQDQDYDFRNIRELLGINFSSLF